MSSVPRVTRSRSRRATALVASGVTLLAVSVVGFTPGTASASSHREAPLTSADPLADNTDVYAFSSPDNKDNVTFVANWIPFEEPNGGPNFYPFGTGTAGYHYYVNIDSNGDGVPDQIYRWTFSSQDARGTNTFLYNNGVVDSLDSKNLLFKQTYTVDVSTDNGGSYGTPIVKDAPVAPSNVGQASMPNYDTNLFQKAVTPVTGGGSSYAGQADDPFFLDLRVFDLLYGAPKLNETGQDTLAGYNVNSVVLELPKSAVALNKDATNNPVIGVWSTTTRQSVVLSAGKQTAGGPEVQVSRLGQPLVNEVVVPAGLKDAFNSLPPKQDATAAGGAVVGKVINPELPADITALYGIPAPTGDPGAGQTTNRTDIAEVFLTGITTALDGKGFYGKTLGAGSDKAPVPLNLNSQLLNKDSADPTTFQPSEMLRLNMALTGPTSLGADGKPGPALPKASPLGVLGGDIQGFPNGRRLADDVVDIEISALGGALLGDKQSAQATALKTGDGVGVNDKPFTTTFPYIASPHNTSVNKAQGGTVTVTAPAPATAPASSTAPASGGVKTPVGGVDTGAGGSTPRSTALPLVSGAAAVLLIAAGGASILGNRRKRRAAQDTQTLG